MKIKKEFLELRDFWDYVAKEPTNEYCTDSKDGDYNFSKTKNYKEALELAKYGWPEGLENIKELSVMLEKKIGKTVISKEIQPIYDVVGEFPDVGLFLEGNPECMVGFENKKNRVIKIVYNCGVSGGVSHEAITIRGALVCALSDVLEKMGNKTEIFISMRYMDNEGEHYSDFIANIKKANEPLNLDRMSFIFCHPSFLRRLMFRCLELGPLENREIMGYSYGTPEDVSIEDRGDIYFPKIHSSDDFWRREDSLIEHTLKLLDVAGIKTTLTNE